MTRITGLAAAAALLGGLAAADTAAAQPMDDPHGLDFVVIDTDGNGSLSRAELQARAVARLARADANGDGALDRDELIAFVPPSRGGLFDVFSPDPAEAFADRMLALMGATETGRVEIAALADRRVNSLLAFVDTDRDAAVSAGRGRRPARPPPGPHGAARPHRGGDSTGRRRPRAPDQAPRDAPRRD